MKLRQALTGLLIAAATASTHAHDMAAAAAGSCAHAAVVAADTPVAEAPDYLAGDDAADHTQDARAEAVTRHLNYHTDVAAQLGASPDPRDWALATVVTTLGSGLEDVLLPEGAASTNPSDELLGRALEALPNDTLVLWIAIERGDRGNTHWHKTALARLREQETDNAAVWIAVVNDAAKRHDEAAVEASLKRMAASRVFDGHFVDQMKAVADVYRRFPMPAEMVAESGAGSADSAEAGATTGALAVTAAIALPGFQPLVNACRVDPASRRNRERASDCAAIGRLLAARADTLLASRIGPVLLRVSKTYVDADVDAARVDDWTYHNFTSLLPTDENDPAAFERFHAYVADWIATRSELEAMRRMTLRAGLAATPPDDWIDRLSPFSEERLRSDRAVEVDLVGRR